MREEGLRGRTKGRTKPRTTDSRHARPVADNLLDRQFDATSTTPAWVSDINYVEQAFLNGWQRSNGPQGVLFHSDRGSQYASHDFRRTLTTLGFVPSMSRKANCWDNAVAESFFATVKNEEATAVYPSTADAQAGIANDIHGFYNPTRRHSALGNRSPDSYARMLMAAWFINPILRVRSGGAGSR